MIRTQIQLTEAQAGSLKRKASSRGVSMATLIREAVDRTLADDDAIRLRKRALAMAGGFRDREGATDVAERHDDYLAEAFEDWR
jgi:hypothetical protein